MRRSRLTSATACALLSVRRSLASWRLLGRPLTKRCAPADVITRLLDSPLAGPSAVVLIDAAGNIARQRPLLVPELLPPLLRLSERAGAAASSSQAASVAHALKGALVQLLRCAQLEVHVQKMELC